MRKAAILILTIICIASPLSAVAMRFSANGEAAYSHFTGGIDSLRAGCDVKFELGEEFGDRHDLMATISAYSTWEIDSDQMWTSMPPVIGYSLGLSYSYDFTQRFGLRTELGLELGRNRLVEAGSAAFRVGLAPYFQLFTLPENYMSYEILVPAEVAFSASKVELRVGIGFGFHIASRFGEEYVG